MNRMQKSTILNTIINKRAQFACVRYAREVKMKKGCPYTVVKETVARNIRVGVPYEHMASTPQGIHSLPSSMEYVSYPHVLKNNKTGKEFVRIATNSNTKFESHWFVNGREVSKESLSEFMYAESKRSEIPPVMNIGIDNIIYIH